jgi:hypothetical protein
MKSDPVLDKFSEEITFNDLFGDDVEYDDPTRSLEWEEAKHELTKEFMSIPEPSYEVILTATAEMHLAMSEDVNKIDPEDLLKMYHRANNYRWKLADIRHKFSRIFNRRKRIYAILERILTGKMGGSNVEQRKSNAAVELVALSKKLGDSEDALDTIDSHIKTLEYSTIQISQMLNAMKFIYNYEGVGGENWRNNSEYTDIDDSEVEPDGEESVEANEDGESQTNLPAGTWAKISKSQQVKHKRRS